MTSHGTESTLRLVQGKPQAHPPFVLELATAKQGRPWIRSLKQDMPFNQDPTGSYSYKVQGRTSQVVSPDIQDKQQPCLPPGFSQAEIRMLAGTPFLYSYSSQADMLWQHQHLTRYSRCMRYCYHI